MFKKPVRIKSNNQVKASERKTIKDLFCKHFPDVPETEANLLFDNKKEPLNCVKLVTHDNEVLQVYTMQKQPIFFCLRDKILPTVFLLWRLPNLVPSFTTHPQVMSFISSGADLMLPGVVTPPAQSGLSKYGNYSEGTTVSVSLSSNRAPVAVGVTSQSSFVMERSSGGRGKCVQIHHFYGDHLCTLEGGPLPSIPSLGPPEWLSPKDYESDFPQLGSARQEVEPQVEESPTPLQEAAPLDETLVDMDELLHHCFLTSIKYSKSLTLPLLISNFFKLQMLPVVPPGATLDIKKTSYKKLKPFLDAMAKEGLITIKEIKKGVEAITDVNKGHPKFNEFYLKPDLRPKGEGEGAAQHQTTVTEFYMITQNVLPIFQASGYVKGDVVDEPHIRKLVTDYIKANDCQEQDNARLVKPTTDVLKLICKTDNPLAWEEVFEKVCHSMKNCFKVSNAGHEQTLNKGKVSPITMNISLRSGNKKVTLIDNLEMFGINIQEFAKECQHGVAASTSVTPKPPGKKSDQLLVQGNQINFVYNLLTEKYKVPKKYILGLEKAPKKKK